MTQHDMSNPRPPRPLGAIHGERHYPDGSELFMRLIQDRVYHEPCGGLGVKLIVIDNANSRREPCDCPNSPLPEDVTAGDSQAVHTYVHERWRNQTQLQRADAWRAAEATWRAGPPTPRSHPLAWFDPIAIEVASLLDSHSRSWNARKLTADETGFTIEVEYYYAVRGEWFVEPVRVDAWSAPNLPTTGMIASYLINSIEERLRVKGVMPPLKSESVTFAPAGPATEREHVAVDGTVRKSHYGAGRQPWDDIKDLGWAPHFAAGNVLKYVRRAAAKNGEDDLKKARWYWAELRKIAIADAGPAIGVLGALVGTLKLEELTLLSIEPK